MFEIEFYQDNSGKEPVIEYINHLKEKADHDKNSRIKLKKIYEYMEFLSVYGTRIGEPVVKHLDNQIWELRPTDDRLLFFFWKDNKFIILHHFKKKTRTTPKRELNQAKRNMKDYLERDGL